jgi:hypothetical protein
MRVTFWLIVLTALFGGAFGVAMGSDVTEPPPPACVTDQQQAQTVYC